MAQFVLASRGQKHHETTRWLHSRAMQILAARLLTSDTTSFLTGRGVVVTRWNSAGYTSCKAALTEAGITEACYLFWNNRICQYIGMSTQINTRLTWHANRSNHKYASTRMNKDTSVMVFESDNCAWDELELLYDLCPVWNKETQKVPRRANGTVRGHPIKTVEPGAVIAPLFKFI